MFTLRSPMRKIQTAQCLTIVSERVVLQANLFVCTVCFSISPYPHERNWESQKLFNNYQFL